MTPRFDHMIYPTLPMYLLFNTNNNIFMSVFLLSPQIPVVLSIISVIITITTVLIIQTVAVAVIVQESVLTPITIIIIHR